MNPSASRTHLPARPPSLRQIRDLAARRGGGCGEEGAGGGWVHECEPWYDWVLRFNADGPEGLKNRWSAGPARKLTAAHRQKLADLVERGPIPAIHGVVRWRLRDLAQELYEEFGVSVNDSTVGRALRDMGYAKLSARPRHHAQNEYVVEDFKKPSPPSWRKSRRAAPA